MTTQTFFQAHDPLAGIGRRMRSLRERMGINQTELVERLSQTPYGADISRQSHISNLEQSEGEKLPSVRVLT